MARIIQLTIALLGLDSGPSYTEGRTLYYTVLLCVLGGVWQKDSGHFIPRLCLYRPFPFSSSPPFPCSVWFTFLARWSGGHVCPLYWRSPLHWVTVSEGATAAPRSTVIEKELRTRGLKEGWQITKPFSRDFLCGVFCLMTWFQVAHTAVECWGRMWNGSYVYEKHMYIKTGSVYAHGGHADAKHMFMKNTDRLRGDCACMSPAPCQHQHQQVQSLAFTLRQLFPEPSRVSWGVAGIKAGPGLQGAHHPKGFCFPGG